MSTRGRHFECGDTVARFNERAGDYAKYRPSYPPAAIDAIFEGMPSPATLKIVDVGAGTGISSRLLAARGAGVIAVEPNAEMRAEALAGGSDAREGTAQALPVPDGWADIVTAFQAFHWFAAPATLDEFRRVLKPHGRVAIVWNERDDRDPFTRAYGELVDSGSASVQDIFAELVPGSGFGGIRTQVFANAQRLDHEGLLGRVRSTSYAPRDGEEAARLYAALRQVFERFRHPAGTVELIYQTEVHLLEALPS